MFVPFNYKFKCWLWHEGIQQQILCFVFPDVSPSQRLPNHFQRACPRKMDENSLPGVHLLRCCISFPIHPRGLTRPPSLPLAPRRHGIRLITPQSTLIPTSFPFCLGPPDQAEIFLFLYRVRKTNPRKAPQSPAGDRAAEPNFKAMRKF